MAELASKGIKLSFSLDATASSPTWRKMYGLKKVPDMGGDTEKVDVTNLEDSNVRKIDTGVADFGDLTFEFWYNKESTADATDSAQVLETYKVLRANQTAGNSLYYKLEYPDGTGFQWKGSVNVKRSGAGVKEALAFTLTTAVSGTVSDISAAA